MNKLFVGASLVALAALTSTAADAADGAGAVGSTVGELIVTGTRATGMKAADSPAPIQVLGTTALQQVAQPDLIQAIAQNLPSFNAQAFGGDAANLTLSAALRGLSPNDTMVLVNGKRRHATANLAVLGGSPYSGAATADLGLIPVGAIDHIEVLQDGAAAQYGSDAIAGVVNIILKSNPEGGAANATGGQNYENGGKSGAWSFNDGMKLGDKGWVNVTLEERYHEHTAHGGGDRRLFDINGKLLASDSAANAAGAAAFRGSPMVNLINGDAQFNIYNFFYNAGYDLGDGITLYSTGSYSHRNSNSYENYRVPTKVSGTNSLGVTYLPLPQGFNPTESLAEDDYSFGGGIKGSFDGWDWDLSTTYGQDNDDIFTKHSANAQLFPVLAAVSATPVVPQRDFFDGAFRSSEWTTGLDVVKSIDAGMFKPLVLALGAEYRQNKFTIVAGEPSSYFGAGAQSFTGYDPSNAGTHTRHNYAFYADLAADPVENLHLDLAARYENYSDFGGTTVGKLTGRYDFSPMIAIRGTVSNGFRAPTLQEEFYSGTNVSPSSATVQLPANSAPAVIAGFQPLKPEKSTNYSIGFVAHPMEGVQLTLDAYEIDLRNRIQTTGFLYGSVVVGGKNIVISQAVLNAISAHGNTLDSGISYAGISVFTNAVDTKTHGVEATVTYASDFGSYGHVDWNVGLNYNKTSLSKQAALPAQDFSSAPTVITQTSLLSPNALTGLTTATPREKVVGNAYWTLGKWSANLRETIYGESSELTSTSNITTNLKMPAAAITDLTVAYRVTDAIKLEVGANNLFDKMPPSVPNLSIGKPASGGNVWNAPMTFSPYGINGGYYYGRLTLTF